MKDGSYHVASFAASTSAEIRRLDAQVDLFWRSEADLLVRHGLADGMDHLDCGCGPGRLIELLKTTMPSLRCTGLEMDPILVDAARQRFESLGYTDCRVVQGTAENPGLPEQSFDVITMRLVLEHVPDPLLALQSLKRLLRPGGRLMVISNDFEYHTRTWPPVPELDDLYVAYCASRRHDGGDPCIGRRVPQLMKAAGFGRVAQDVEIAHNMVLGDGPFLKAEGVGIPAQLVSSGFLDQAVFERMIQSWKAMLAHPDHCIMRQLFIAVGENTAAVAHEAHQTARPTVEAIRPAPGPGAPAPEGDLEQQIARIWCAAMKVDRVDSRTNFFDLGGDSLMLSQVQTELRDRLGHDVPMAVLFQYPTVESLAGHLSPGAAQPGSEAPPALPADTPGPDSAAPEADDDLRMQAMRRRGALIGRRTGTS